MFEKVVSIISECLEKSSNEIQGSDEFRNYEEWDSLAYLSVTAAIDEQFGFVIPLEDFRECRTVMDLANYLEHHIIG